MAGKALTLKEFKKAKIYQKYTPLELKDILHLMKEYEDIYIITDTKETKDNLVKKQFINIVSTAEEIDPKILERVIPQIYNERMLKVIMDIYEFNSVIYTLYQTNHFIINNHRVETFASNNKNMVITMSTSRYSREFAERLSNRGIFTYVHTINSIEQADLLQNNGVYGFYTDFIVPRDISKQ